MFRLQDIKIFSHLKYIGAEYSGKDDTFPSRDIIKNEGAQRSYGDKRRWL